MADPTSSLPAERPLRALLLEDNRFDAELTVETLRQSHDAEITVVTDGAAFRRAMEQPEFDIILSDFAIPGFSGTEALELALVRCPDTPFVFISGVLGEEHAVDMLKRGATDYVVKARLSRLPLVVARAIAEARERQQRRQAERALRESENTFTRVVESLQDYGVLLLEPTGEIRFWNHAAERIFGYSLQEVRGHSAALLFLAEDRETGHFQRGLDRARGRGSVVDDRWLARRDGTSFFANSVTTAFLDDEGQLSGFSWIVRDTTTARWAAEALQAAKLEAERASQAKDRFIAVLSHELRTPLVPILTGAQVLASRLTLPRDLESILAMIQRNVALEARLIDDLLDVTGIERGKLVIDLTPIDAHAALRGALETTREEAESKGLRVKLGLKARNAIVLGDEARLQQIFWNLVRNAVKFTPFGGEIAIDTDNPDGEHLRVRVRDSGIGIAPDVLPHIFTPFEQAQSSRTHGFGGLGLGLAIARGLAQKHGGDLSAHSDGEGRGATFSFQLRTLAPLAEEAPVDVVTAPDEDAPRLGILLVEDNPDAEAALRFALESAGHRVTSARSVAEARDTIRRGHFDLLVSDIGLPDGTGRDVLAHVQGRFPAIALSGYGMEEDVRASLEAGFAYHLIKPVDSARLRDAINEAARMHNTRDADSREPLTSLW